MGYKNSHILSIIHLDPLQVHILALVGVYVKLFTLWPSIHLGNINALGCKMNSGLNRVADLNSFILQWASMAWVLMSVSRDARILALPPTAFPPISTARRHWLEQETGEKSGLIKHFHCYECIARHRVMVLLANCLWLRSGYLSNAYRSHNAMATVYR